MPLDTQVSFRGPFFVGPTVGSDFLDKNLPALEANALLRLKRALTSMIRNSEL